MVTVKLRTRVVCVVLKICGPQRQTTGKHISCMFAPKSEAHYNCTLQQPDIHINTLSSLNHPIHCHIQYMDILYM